MSLLQNDDQEPRARLTPERKWGWWKLVLFLLGFGLFCTFFYRLANGQEATENHDPKSVPGVVLLPAPDMEVDGVVVASRTDVQNKLQAIAISINGLKERSDSQLALLRETVEQLKKNSEDQAVTIAALRKIVDHPFNRVPYYPSIDFTTSQQLKEFLPRGYVVYHSQANDYGLKNDLLPAIEKTPYEGVLMLDIEDWIAYPTKIPYYGTASDAEALKYLRGYAKMIRDATPSLKAKRITLGVYEVPTTLWKNYVWARNDPSDAGYKRWLENQERVLRLAEQSDFLPALRDAGGFVCVVGYLPQEWHGHKFAPKWMEQLIDNVSRELDQRNVPHRWLFRLHGGNEQIYKTMVSKARGRCDIWEDRPMATEAATFGKLLLADAKASEAEK